MDRNELRNYARALEIELARARKRPFSTLKDKLRFKVMRKLSKSRLLPTDMTARFSRSAEKRNPLRSLRIDEIDPLPPAPTAEEMRVAAAAEAAAASAAVAEAAAVAAAAAAETIVANQAVGTSPTAEELRATAAAEAAAASAAVAEAAAVTASAEAETVVVKQAVGETAEPGAGEDEPTPDLPDDIFQALTEEELTSIAIRKGRVRKDPARPNALVVTHEASLTGAPVLAFNMAEQLAQRYNVIVFSLGAGDLLDAFASVATEILVTDRLTVREGVYARMVEHLIKAGGAKLAVVNSVESRFLLKPLAAADIPAVTLIHEFASYTHDRERVYPEIKKLSKGLVFSSDLTRDNAKNSAAMSVEDNVHVVPQGRCRVPGAKGRRGKSAAAAAALRAELRPAGDSDKFVVMAAGSVEYRKGLDLFVECANRLVTGPGGDKYDFVWFGSGYRPHKAYEYSSFVSDQIGRSRLIDRLRILPPTEVIETAYQCADVLILPSRLDPLPNVVIDSTSVGLPVICFDSATGIAPILQDADLGFECVARYLDPSDMADKVRKLAEDPKLFETVRLKSIEMAADRFDFAAYTARVEALALADGASDAP